MKKTTIKIRAFCNTFNMDVTGLLTMEEATKHVTENFIDTAMVVGITHKEEITLAEIVNDDYKDPTHIGLKDGGFANKYFKNNQNGKEDNNG